MTRNEGGGSEAIVILWERERWREGRREGVSEGRGRERGRAENRKTNTTTLLHTYYHQHNPQLVVVFHKDTGREYLGVGDTLLLVSLDSAHNYTPTNTSGVVRIWDVGQGLGHESQGPTLPATHPSVELDA